MKKFDRNTGLGGTEIWKPVLGYETHYQVSNLGRVKRIVAGPGARAGRILKPVKHNNGYLMVALCNGKSIKQFQVHRLVLIAFKGPFPKNKVSSHLNGIKINNALKNLAFMTQKENQIHGRDVLGVKYGVCGVKHHSSKLTPNKIRKIKKLRKETKMSQREIGILLDVTQTAISKVLTGRNWRHI